MLEAQESIASSLRSIAKTLKARDRPFEQHSVERRTATQALTTMRALSSPAMDRLEFSKSSVTRVRQKGLEERPTKRTKVSYLWP